MYIVEIPMGKGFDGNTDYGTICEEVNTLEQAVLRVLSAYRERGYNSITDTKLMGCIYRAE